MDFSYRTTRRSFLLSLVLPWLAASLIAQDDWKARDLWQKPQEVMDVLGIKAGSSVADIGAGEGYFTFHLAQRVGSDGKVYAEDILADRLDKIRERASAERLSQIETILGATDDPRLPAESVDVILVVNAYHEMRDHDAMLRGMFRALKPGGLLAVIDAPAKPGQPRENYFERHRIPEQFVRDDVARNGFAFLRRRPTFVPPDRDRTYFFLIFQKPPLNAP
ncbi:MAG TPA: class I SAM-dependent methyltransferase [Candidatus Acidoferrum sp.]|jgi:predicted methyltransferase